MKKILKGFIFPIIVIGVSIFLAIYKPIRITFVSGQSMSPTLYDKEIILTYKREEQINDIITFQAPSFWSSTNQSVIKRLIAKEGDILTFDVNSIYVNNKEIYLDKDIYVPEEVRFETIVIPKGKYFVMGDNIGNSKDSFYFFTIGNQEYLIDSNTVEYSTKGENFE